ncbi:MAG: biopolymer transporter ExbD [Planctomycetota bacterium]|nr:biopolymer transporter ExbD [Planctomycetota bacterium]
MSNGDQPRASSSGAVIAIVAVVVLLMLGGLLVLGLAGFLFLRVRAAPQVIQPPQFTVGPIMAEPMKTVELPAERQAPGPAEAPPQYGDIRKIAVQLDPQGKILVDGQAVDMGGLKNLLVKAREDGTIRLEVVVEVDRQCLFEHVAAVQAVCKEAGVENVRVQALTASPD